MVDLQDTDADGTVEEDEITARYLWGNAVDQIFAQEDVSDITSDGDVLWTLTDNLGSVRDLAAYDAGTDTTTIDEHYTFGSFGQLDSGDASKTRYLYTAQEYDADVELFYYDNRWHDPATGQFISADPIQDDLDNTYRYVGNGSTYARDPSGLQDADSVINAAGEVQFTYGTSTLQQDFDLSPPGMLIDPVTGGFEDFEASDDSIFGPPATTREFPGEQVLDREWNTQKSQLAQEIQVVLANLRNSREQILGSCPGTDHLQLFGDDALDAGGDIGKELAKALWDRLRGKGFEEAGSGTLSKPLTAGLHLGGRTEGDDAIGTLNIKFEISRPVGIRGAGVTYGATFESDLAETNIPEWEDYNDLPNSLSELRHGNNDLSRRATDAYNRFRKGYQHLNSADDWADELCEQLHSQPAARVRLSITIDSHRKPGPLTLNIHRQFGVSVEIDPNTGEVTSSLSGVLTPQ